MLQEWCDERHSMFISNARISLLCTFSLSIIIFELFVLCSHFKCTRAVTLWLKVCWAVPIFHPISFSLYQRYWISMLCSLCFARVTVLYVKWFPAYWDLVLLKLPEYIFIWQVLNQWEVNALWSLFHDHENKMMVLQ